MSPNPNHSARLAGKVAIVTGGSAGLGRSICDSLSRQGASVAIVGRNRQRLTETGRSLRQKHAVDTLELQLDVLKESDMRAMADEVIQRFGKIDILVSSAGILRPPGLGMKTLAQTPVDAWDAIVNTNLRGLFLGMRAVLPAMMQQRCGDIVAISSKSAIKGLAFDCAYCASKSAIVGLTQAVAEEAQSAGVRVQTILPGTFDTDLWEQNSVMSRPPDLPPPERVAELVIKLVTMPRDACLLSPLVEPVKTVAMPNW